MKFIIKEVLVKEVEAEDRDSVEEAYQNSEIVLTADDFDHADIYPKEQQEKILDITTKFCENECEYKNTCDENCIIRKIERVLEPD